MKKRILISLFIVLGLFVITGCGSNKVNPEAEKKANELVEEESIVRRARVESEELRENARQEAANLHKNTLDYIDSLLAETDRKMSELINNIRLERSEIQNHR